MGELSKGIEHKISLSRDLADRLSSLPRPIVMTNGVFDVLHRGHVSYLNRGAELGGSLLVAINSDTSVRMLGKGPDRPLNTEEDRAFVLAGLESVDVVTIFHSRTPVELIKEIRPDIYIKGGDYDMDSLEETHLVRSWGGQSLAIPFVDGFSTTAIVAKIKRSCSSARKAAFLDHDGVINKDSGFVYRWENFEFLPNAIMAMQILQKLGYVIVIVTNQSGIARGYYNEFEYKTLTELMIRHLNEQGVNIDAIYHCPHHPQGSVPTLAVNCKCRKPEPGMIFNAERELNLSLSDSIMIGDKASDVAAARAAGIGRVFSIAPNNQEATSEKMNSDMHFASFFECASYLLLNS